MSAREEMLGRIRAALTDVPAAEAPVWDPARDDDPAAAYVRADPDPDGGAARAAHFAQRCGAYRATVSRCPDEPGAIRDAVAGACARQSVTGLVIAPGVPADWRPNALTVCEDEPPLSPAQLDGAEAALTGCALAIAETGTIVLDGGPGQGRRALTLVPDVHVCVVRAEQIVAGVPAAVAEMERRVTAHGRALTLISGPSATSDIELERVEGVHGPRRLEIILAG